MDDFNKEVFIEEVEKRPVIWNTECPEYSDKILKRKAWNELTEIFADPSYSNEKKSIFSIQLQRKWKNLKDTYMKEYKKIKSHPYHGSQKGSSYMYYSKLSFLQKCLQTKPTTSTSDVSQMMEVDQNVKASELLASMNDSLQELMQTASSLERPNKLKVGGSHSSFRGMVFDSKKSEDRPRKANATFRVPEQNYRLASMEAEKLLESKKKSQRFEDDDKLFCMSLYKEIRKVPENNRLAVKIELLNVLQKAQTLPMNEIRMPYQHAGVNTMPPFFGQYLTNAWTDQGPISGTSQPEQSISPLTPIIRELRVGQSTSSEPRLTKRLFVPPLREPSPPIKMDSPLSSLDSSHSSNCSIHNYMDTYT